MTWSPRSIQKSVHKEILVLQTYTKQVLNTVTLEYLFDSRHNFSVNLHLFFHRRPLLIILMNSQNIIYGSYELYKSSHGKTNLCYVQHEFSLRKSFHFMFFFLYEIYYSLLIRPPCWLCSIV